MLHTYEPFDLMVMQTVELIDENDNLKLENAKLRELALKNWHIALSERFALSAHGINPDGNALDVEIRIARDKMRELGVIDE